MAEENQHLTSKPNKIIVKAKEQLYTFEKGTYHEGLLSDIISKKEYDEIIDNCGKVMGQSWAKKRLNDQIKIPSGIILLSVIAVLLTIAYMVTLYLSATSEDGTALFVISIICISLASIIVFGMSIFNFCRKIAKFKSLDQIIKEDLDKEFQIINAKYSGSLLFEYDDAKKQIIITPKEGKYNRAAAYNNPENEDGYRNVEMKKIK